MNIADYIVNFLIDNGVTDVFGIPGNLVLEFLYAMDRRKNEIQPHLSYHEQSAAISAASFAQISGRLSVAYSTKGPGITNMLSGVADAYYDSIPLLVITAHSSILKYPELRVEKDQEFDTISLMSPFTKYSTKVENILELEKKLYFAYIQATTGRPGPVFLDFNSNIFKEDATKLYNKKKIKELSVAPKNNDNYIAYMKSNSLKKIDIKTEIEHVFSKINEASRPIVLIGDGIRQARVLSLTATLIEKLKIPVLSSRFSQDILSNSRYFYGYIGSHGTRYSNYILSKSDFILALGNRLAFDKKSNSFGSISENTHIVRIDIDEKEFVRDINSQHDISADLNDILPEFINESSRFILKKKWVRECDYIKRTLLEYDIDFPIPVISSIMKTASSQEVITSDVGNNELWLSRSYEYSKCSSKLLYSKSFGLLGCSLPKAIGAYFATKENVICFTGDQGMQMNLQELEFVSLHRLPILIVILNNNSSGMIRSRQKRLYNGQYIHTTRDTGYGTPNFERIAQAYAMQYLFIDDKEINVEDIVDKLELPAIVEVSIDEDIDVCPFLPLDNECYDFEPKLPDKLKDMIEKL
ncbi:MAG: thiamine pyrophosphate-binding protein [Rickettsia sp.]|jgi:acetolactate synthase-1/2/3 large subunit|nr:thiamine pyrophosphate-binding protein [Rickettsia sp.]